KYFLINNHSNDDFRVLNTLLDADVVPVSAIGGFQQRTISKDLELPPIEAFRVPADARTMGALAKVLPGSSTRIEVEPASLSEHLERQLPRYSRLEIRKPRIGLYQPWMPNMDEGWTRLVLERFGFPYETLHNAEIRAGRLKSRIDTLLIPSVDTKTL